MPSVSGLETVVDGAVVLVVGALAAVGKLGSRACLGGNLVGLLLV